MTRSTELLTVGRPGALIQPPFAESDKTIASQRFEGQTIPKGEFKHCTFINVSFKESRLENTSFLDCIFIDCYFRRATLANCDFVGSRFIDCRFPNLSLRCSDFRYATFTGCYIESNEMQYSLPTQDNLREELARNLSIEASRMGAWSESGTYREIEILAHERHLSAAVLGHSQWYREHFDRLARVRALSELLLSLLNRILLGYGVRPGILLRNWALASLVIFPTVYYLLSSQFTSLNGQSATTSAFIMFSIKYSIPAPIDSILVPTGLGAIAAALLQAIFSGTIFAFFASYIFRWSLKQ